MDIYASYALKRETVFRVY